MKGIAKQLGMTVLVGLAVACDPFAPSKNEVARVASPSGTLEAVVIETNGGATTSFGYEVLVVPKRGRVSQSSEVAFLYGAGRSTEAYGVTARWRSEDRLAVEYLDARSASLKQARVTVAGQSVEVLLAAGITDPTAPRGGMLYNLERGGAR